MTKASVFGLVGLATLLCGCSAEPDERDIFSAVKTWVDKHNELMRLPPDLAVEFIFSRKISCIEAEENQYQCEADLERIAPVVGRQKQVVSVLMFKENGTWKVAE